MKQLGAVDHCGLREQSTVCIKLIGNLASSALGKQSSADAPLSVHLGCLALPLRSSSILHKCRTSVFVRTFIAFLISFFVAIPVYSEPAKNKETNTNSAQAPEIHLLVDVSGSMKKTDPQNLRVKAIKMFTYLIKQKAAMGIQVFATQTEQLLPPAPVTADFQKELNKKTYKITSDGAWTDIDGALNAANQGWHSEKKVIVLLTDGTLDLGSESLTKASRDKLTQSTISKLEQDGVRVFSIGFSNAADKQLLNDISVKTNGLSSIVLSANDLDTLLYTIFTAIIPANGTPLTTNKDTTRSINIDKNIHEMTLVFKKGAGIDSLYLTDPKHSKKSVLDLTSKDISTLNYSFINIKNPITGEWILSGPAQEIERALILTDINLISNFQSGVYFEGEALLLSSHLEDKGSTITSPLFLEHMMMIVNLNNKEQQYSYNLPNKSEGLFKKKVTLGIPKGNYSVVILAKNEGFSREIQFIIDVYDIPFTSELTSSSSTLLKLNNPELIKADATKVQVQLDKKVLDLPVIKASNSWEVDLKSLCGSLSDRSKLFLKVNTETLAGRSITFKMPIALNFCPQPVLESDIPQITQKKAAPVVVHKAPVVKEPVEIKEQAKETKAIVEAERSKFNYKIILYGICILLLLVGLFALIFTVGVKYGKKLNKIKKDLREDLKEESTDEKKNDE